MTSAASVLRLLKWGADHIARYLKRMKPPVVTCTPQARPAVGAEIRKQVMPMVCVPLSYLRGQYGIVRENGRGEDPLLEPVERYSQTSHKRPGKVMIVKEPNGAQAGDVVRYEVIKICRNCIHVRVAEIIIRNTSPTEASLLYFQIRTGSEGVHLVPPDGSPILERFEEGTIVGVLFVSVKPPKRRRRRQAARLPS